MVAGLFPWMYDDPMDTATKTTPADAPKLPSTHKKAEYAHFDAIEAVNENIDSALAEAEHRILLGTMEAADIIGFLRVELGRQDARGPHYPAPGMENFEEPMDRLLSFVEVD